MAGYQLRSQLYIQQAEYSKAIEDLQAMSDASPKNEGLLQQLALLYSADLRPEESIKIYSDLLRDSMVPDEGDQPSAVRRVMMAKRADLLNRRADARLSTGQHSKALSDYNESLSLIDQLLELFPETDKGKPPRGSGLLNNFAWLLATSPEDDLRDGERAIKLATEAAEITKFEQAHILSTVAAGYAETGDFESAIEWIEKGLKANEAAGEKEGALEEAIASQEKSLRDELESYQDEKPWREQTDPKEERAKAKKEKEKKSDKDDSDEEENENSDEAEDKPDSDADEKEQEESEEDSDESKDTANGEEEE